MFAKWIAFCAIGEALGIAGVATGYALADRGLAPLVPAVLLAGAWEGLALGAMQAAFLRRFGVRFGIWVPATVAAALLGYGMSLLGGAGATEAPASPEPALITILGLAAAMGAVMGAIMGAVQGVAGRPAIAFRPWVAANAVGWALAMVAIFGGSALATSVMPLVAVTALGAVSGALAGGLLGLATSFALPESRRA